jgi:hypothetical protein
MTVLPSRKRCNMSRFRSGDDESRRRGRWVVILILIIRLFAFVSVLTFAGCLLYAGVGVTVTTGCVAAVTVAASTSARRLTADDAAFRSDEGPEPLAV